MLVTEKKGKETFADRIKPRVFKATIIGIITFFLYYVLPTLLFSTFPTENLPSEFDPYFSRYENLFYIFAAIIICFAVVNQLSSGTIFQHAFNVAKAIILIIYFIYALEGGILTLSMSLEGNMVNIVANLTAFLAILISVNLLTLAKNMLEAINFLSQKVEQPPTEITKEEEMASIPELK